MQNAQTTLDLDMLSVPGNANKRTPKPLDIPNFTPRREPEREVIRCMICFDPHCPHPNIP